MIRLFVGLGNPGAEYERTRHNAGFWWIDELARELKCVLSAERAYHGLVARAHHRGHTVWLLEPLTYMNLSGKSVAALARFFRTWASSTITRSYSMRDSRSRCAA